VRFVQNVSTFLIIFRIAQGKGWSQDTVTRTLGGHTMDTYETGGQRESERPIRFRTMNTATAESQVRSDTVYLPKTDEAASNTASSGFIESGLEKVRAEPLDGA
jgi:hypothetical protein